MGGFCSPPSRGRREVEMQWEVVEFFFSAGHLGGEAVATETFTSTSTHRKEQA